MVPSLLSVFTFYIIAAIAPADAKLQPRAVRHGFLSVRSDYPTGVATHTLAVASTGPTHKEGYLLEKAMHTLPQTTNIYCNALAVAVDAALAVTDTVNTDAAPSPNYPVVLYTTLDTEDETTEYKDLSAWLDLLADLPADTWNEDDERRAKRRARRMRSWLREHGLRLFAEREAREVKAVEACNLRWRARLEFMTMLPATIARWSAIAGPHHLAALLTHIVIATADANPATFALTHYWLPPHWVFHIYAAIRSAVEWIIDELLICAYLTAQRAVHEALDYFKIICLFGVWWPIACTYDRMRMTITFLPAVLEYYAWLPAFKRGQAFNRELSDYEYRKLRSAALFIFEEWNQQRYVIPQRVFLSEEFQNSGGFGRGWRYITPIACFPGWRRYEGAAHASRCEGEAMEPVHKPESFLNDVLRRWSLLFLACALRVLFATVRHLSMIMASGVMYAGNAILRCGRVGALSASLVAILIEYGVASPDMVEIIFISLAVTTVRPIEWLCVLRRAARAALAWRNVTFLAVACRALGAGDEQSSLKCTVFDGVSSTWVAWLISFTAWVAYKEPKLLIILSGGAATRPNPADATNPTVDEQERLNEWSLLNIKLYGSVLLHLSSPLQASVFTSAPNDGAGAIKYLRDRFGSSTSGDRAEATARLQATHIDKRAGLSEADLVLQHNEMQQAAADIVAAGGTRPDDSLLISFFENALPSSYTQIRQMVRYRGHAAFSDYYNDVLTQVKAELKASSQPALGAFAIQGAGRGGRGRGRGRGNQLIQQPPTGGQRNNPCFNCGNVSCMAFECPHEPTNCAHCPGRGHMSELCPRGPGGPLRDQLSANAKAALERQVSKAENSRKKARKARLGVQDDDNSSVASGTAIQHRSVSEASFAHSGHASDPVAMLAAQFHAFRLGRASSAAGSSAAHSALPPSTAHTATVNPQELQPPDELEEFMTAIANTSRLAQRRAQLCTSQPSIMAARRGISSVIASVDSQASNFVVPSADYLIKVTHAKPGREWAVDTANGSVIPDAVGIAGVHLLDKQGGWHFFEVSGVLVLPSCDRVLYSQPTMAEQHGIIHNLDFGHVRLPSGHEVPVTRQSYTIEITFGPQMAAAAAYPAKSVMGSPSTEQHSRVQQPTSADEGAALVDEGAAPERDRGADSTASVPQYLLWQRLGFPSAHAWRHVRDVLSDHHLPDSGYLRTDFGVVDAVARARARALPFHSLRDPESVPPPGAVLYLDHAGPMIASYPHRFTYYCGVVDAGSQYARVYACHGPTKESARRAQEGLIADISALMGLTHLLKTSVVISDQGSAFMSQYFRDFLLEAQTRHWPSTVYRAQQNAVVERMWGTRFAMARALLAHANLGPAWHPWALQTANWICNRLPLPSRGNQSPFGILSRTTASVAYLRTFGCLVRVLVPLPRREGDRHFADRGQLGICLGPSEESPGTCVYIPSKRQFVTSREVIFYEDSLPGVRGVESAWREVSQETGVPGDERVVPASEATPMTETASPAVETAAKNIAGSPSQPPASPLHTQGPHRRDSVPPSPQQLVFTSPGPMEGPTSSFTVPTTAPDGGSGLDLDPKQLTGGNFQRGLGRFPQRERKPPASILGNVSSFGGKSYANFVNPSVAGRPGAVANYVILSGLDPLLGPPSFVYQSNISGLGAAFAVSTTSTTDLGDIIIPRGYRQALESRWAEYWREAIAKELNGLISRDTWEVVRADSVPAKSNVMACHMVFTVKRNEDGTIEKFKCRLVANGNTQKQGVDFDRIFSTVVKITTIRVVFAIAAARDYNLTSIDVQQAYLQATLTETLYMRMPPGLPSRAPDGTPLLVQLKKSLYGLKQAGRAWWLLLTSFLTNWGFTQSTVDVCLYTYQSGSSILWLLVWVDDTIIVDNDVGLRERFVADLGRRFPVEDKRDLSWILGVKVCRDRKRRTLSMSQELYVNDLVTRHASLIDGLTKRFDSPCDASVELTPDQCPARDSEEWRRMQSHHADYMALVGAFLWLSNVTRPELSYIASQLCRFVSNPGQVHYSAALRVLLYLKGSTDRCLTYKPSASRPLRIFVDSNWGVKYSISGACFELMGCNVHWFAKTQRSVSLSSTEAEWFAAMVAAREGLFFRDLLVELGLPVQGPTVMRSDNKSVKDLSLDAVAFKKTKHILRAANFLRDLCDRLFFEIVWISGKSNPADIFTKAQDLATFRSYLALLDHLDGIPATPHEL